MQPRPGGTPPPTGRELPARAALALLCLAPLAVDPGGETRFAFAKLLVVTLGLLVAVAAPRGGALPPALLAVGALASAVFVITALAGGTPEASLVGRWPRYEGLPTLLIYAGAAWAGARLLGPGPEDDGGEDDGGEDDHAEDASAFRGRLVTPLSLAAVVLAVASVLDVAGIGIDGIGGGPGRDGSLVGNATDQGAVGLMALVTLAAAALADGPARRRGIAAAGAVGGLVTVAASGSRTTLALSVAGSVVLGLLRLHRSRQADRADRADRGWIGWAVALGLPTALVAAALVVPTTRRRLLGTATGDARLHQWRLTAHLLGGHPLLGVGPSRYVDAFGRYEDAGFVRFTGPHVLADSPHSVALQVLCGGGLLLGLVVAVAAVLVGRRVVAVVRAQPDALGPALAVAAYVALLLVNFTAPGPTCLAALLLGSVVAQPAPARSAPAPAVRAAGGAAAVSGLAVLLVLLVAACVGDVRLRQGLDAAARGHPAATVRDLDAARAWLPWDSDVDMLGAQALAQVATDRGGADGPTRRSAAGACLDLADRSLAHTRDNATSLVARGVCLLALGRLGRAGPALDAAVAAAPQRPDAYVQRAILRYAEHDRPGARADLARARAIEPHSPVVGRLARGIG